MGKKRKKPVIQFPDPDEIKKVAHDLETKGGLKGKSRCKAFGKGFDLDDEDCEDCIIDYSEYGKACGTFTHHGEEAIRQLKMKEANRRKPKTEQEAKTMGKKKKRDEEEEEEVTTKKKKKKKGKAEKKGKKVKKGKKGKKAKKGDSKKTNLRGLMRDMSEAGKKDKVIIKKATAILMKEKGYDEDHAEARAKAKLRNVKAEE